MVSNKVRTMLDMIRFEHTVFALPFAYMGMVLGARGLPSLKTFLLVTCAMVGARTFAMSLNRLFDLPYDRINPRTASWALPQGLVSVGETLLLAGIALAVFFAAVLLLPDLCRRLWPVVLIPMALYSLTKRFTWLCHAVLGLCLGLAPPGAWIAVTNTLPPVGILLLGLAVMCWTAGFDIIYSSQDYAFDVAENLHSIPARFGIPAGLVITRFLHALSVLLLTAAGLCLGLGVLYFIGTVIIAAFLFYENSIVSPQDLSAVTTAFFTMNGFVSIAAFVFTFLSIS